MRDRSSDIWQVTVRLVSGPADPFAEAVGRNALGVSAFEEQDGSWEVSAFHPAEPDREALRADVAMAAGAAGLPEPALEIIALPPTDWLAQSYAGFPPRRIDRFYIHGSHIAPPPGGLIALHIDAATAFGSGEHATTEGCLRAIAALGRRRLHIARALDMGAGSGILAIAIAKRWKAARVAAVDIDAESARVAGVNARLNRVGARVRAVRGDGYRSPLAARGGTFDLIVANILARPLVSMAPALARRLKPGGIAILSGLLRRQEQPVLAAHRMAGLRLVGRRPIGEWQTLILRR